MTSPSPLRIPEEQLLAQRDFEEAWWMVGSLGKAIAATRSGLVSIYLYDALVCFRQLSPAAQEPLVEAFKAGYAAGLARMGLLEQEAKLVHARAMVAACEAEVSRCACVKGMPGSHACAVSELAQWQRRVMELEGRMG